MKHYKLIEVTDELLDLVKEFKHYGTDSIARHLAAYICEVVGNNHENPELLEDTNVLNKEEK